ncbi:unnamed protein product [Ixodes persulcatus]
MLDITVGATQTQLPNVVIAPLPAPLDVILGSEWRQQANVDVTFHASNNVTIVQLLNDDNDQSAHYMRDSKTPTHPKSRTAETLIVSFCKREATTPTDFEETKYVTLYTKQETPNKKLLQDIDEAVSEMTKDATPEEADKLRCILTWHSEAFVTNGELL